MSIAHYLLVILVAALLLVVPWTDIAVADTRACTLNAAGDGCVFDLQPIVSGLLKIDTLPDSTVFWRATLVEVGKKTAKTNIGNANVTTFSGRISKSLIFGRSYELSIVYEGPLPGTFPTTVQIRFTGSVILSGPRPTTGNPPGGDLALSLPNDVKSAGSWSNPTNLLELDGNLATSCPPGTTTVLRAFEFPNVSGTIDGIEVECKGGKAATNTCSGGQPGPIGNLEVALSPDGGTTLTTRRDLPCTNCLTTGLAILRIGGPTDTWGRTWSPAEIKSMNFEMHLSHSNNEGTFQADYCAIRVFYTP